MGFITILPQKDEDGHQSADMFSPNVTMVPKSTTGLEDKPLLPSVFRPDSALYTTPMTYLGSNQAGPLAVQNVPTNFHLNNAGAYGSLNVPAIQVADSSFSANNVVNPLSFKPSLSHEVSLQSRLPLLPPGSNASSFVRPVGAPLPLYLGNIASSLVRPVYSTRDLYSNVPHGQNIVPLPGSTTSTLVKISTNTPEVYGDAPQQAGQTIPHHYGMPNTSTKFDQRSNNTWQSLTTGLPIDSYVQPVVHVKPVSAVRGNLVEINTTNNQQNYSTHLYTKDFYNQTDNPSIYNPSTASLTFCEQMEFSSDHDTRRPFFGEIKSSPDLRQSASLGSFVEKRPVLPNREITTDYEENRYYDSCKDISLSEDVHRLPMESKYFPDEFRGYYRNDGSSPVEVGRLYTRDKNVSSSYGIEKSSYLEAKEMEYLPKGIGGFHNESRDRLNAGRSSAGRRSYSKESSNTRSRSRSPRERRRHSSSRSSRERTESSKQGCNTSRGEDKLRNERRRQLSPEQKRDSRRSEKTRRQNSVSPRRKTGSSNRERNERSDRSLSGSVGESESGETPKKSDRRSSPGRSLSSRDDKDRSSRLVQESYGVM
jgi:hypothetical protein